MNVATVSIPDKRLVKAVVDRPKANGQARPEYIFGIAKALHPTTINVEITPEIAEMLLAMRPAHQRPMKPARVRAFRDLLARGQFVYTHQGLGFDVNGHLIDGQHRLTAIVAERSSAVMQATFGLPVEVFSALDRGATRSVADDLMTSGQAETAKEACTMSAATRVLHLLKSGTRVISASRMGAWTLARAAEIQMEHPHLTTACKLAQSLPRHIPRAAFAAMYSTFAMVDKKLADEFAAKLITGENIGRGHPVYHLREWCLSNLDRGASRYKSDGFIFRAINAWNAMRKGKPMVRLRGETGDNPTYPKIL